MKTQHKSVLTWGLIGGLFFIANIISNAYYNFSTQQTTTLTAFTLIALFVCYIVPALKTSNAKHVNDPKRYIFASFETHLITYGAGMLAMWVITLFAQGILANNPAIMNEFATSPAPNFKQFIIEDAFGGMIFAFVVSSILAVLAGFVASISKK